MGSGEWGVGVACSRLLANRSFFSTAPSDCACKLASSQAEANRM